MALLKINTIICLALLLVCCAYNLVLAQVVPVSSGGKIFTIGVNPQPGSTYFWKIYSDYTLSREAPITDARFVQTNQGSTVSIELIKRGKFFYTVTAFGPTGCSNLKAGYLEYWSPVTAVAGSDQVIGYCQTANLDASRSIGEISSYKWESADSFGILSTPDRKSTQLTISPTYSGSYPATLSVLLTVKDQYGNSDKDTIRVIVDQPIQAEVYISGKTEKDGSMMVDGSISRGSGLSYRWYTQDGKIMGDNQKPLVLLNGAGIYNLEVTDSHGCRSLKSFRFPLKSGILQANDDFARLFGELQITVPVLINDYDPDNDIDPTTVKILDNPLQGNAIPNKNGTVTYIYSEAKIKTGKDQFTYQVCDSLGTCGSARVTIYLEGEGITPTEAFSPNGDNLNDQLVFKGLENYPQSQLYIYTRGGQLVYSSQDYRNNWDGKVRVSNQLLPTGTYYYILKLGGTDKTIKGFVFIDY